MTTIPRPRRRRTFGAVLAVAAVLVTGCGTGSAGTASPSGPAGQPTSPLPAVGTVPDPVQAAGWAELTDCSPVDDHRIGWTITVTNSSEQTRLVRGAGVSVTSTDGQIFGKEGTGWLGNLGPGRFFRVSGVMVREDRSLGDDPTCTLGAQPADEEYEPVTVGDPVPAADVSLLSCGTGVKDQEPGELRIRNSSDRPAAVYAAVEYFGADGRSLGQEKVSYRPERSSYPKPAVAPGTARSLELAGPVHQQPAAGEKLSCAVLSARIELDPEPDQVIYD